MSIAIDLKVTDLEVVYRISLRNGVLVYSTFTQSSEADVIISTAKAAVPMLLLGSIESLEKAGVQIAGDKSKLETLFSVLEAPDPDFAIVTP